jgi:hypothetical protein
VYLSLAPSLPLLPIPLLFFLNSNKVLLYSPGEQVATPKKGKGHEYTAGAIITTPASPHSPEINDDNWETPIMHDQSEMNDRSETNDQSEMNEMNEIYIFTIERKGRRIGRERFIILFYFILFIITIIFDMKVNIEPLDQPLPDVQASPEDAKKPDATVSSVFIILFFELTYWVEFYA